MKLIVQNIDGDTFCYVESERHFKTAEKIRGTTRLDSEKLAEQCDLSAFVNFHFVFNIKQ